MYVSPVCAEERAAVLRLFFQNLPEADREVRVAQALRLAANGELPAEALLACRDGENFVGAIVALPLAGAAALVWPPQVAPGVAQLAIEDLLLQTAAARFQAGKFKFCQALLAPTEFFCAGPLERNGFHHITALLYLQRDLDDLETTCADSDCPRFQTYAECNQGEFHQALLASYEETLDCPELNGLRSIDEIVAGYRSVPSCRLDRWWLAWHQGEPAGVLITVAMADPARWELAYLGLVPAARRQGLGTQLTRKALTEAKAAGATSMILTVDARNAPALRMYEALGFSEYDRREVFLRVFKTP